MSVARDDACRRRAIHGAGVPDADVYLEHDRRPRLAEGGALPEDGSVRRWRAGTARPALAGREGARRDRDLGGNHAQALAWGAAAEGIDCLVVMWRGASESKIAATRGYGAVVDLEQPGRQRRSPAWRS